MCQEVGRETNTATVTLTLGSLGLTIAARMRADFAIHLLSSAVEAARKAHAIETANATADHGPWFDEMLHAVPVAVIMSAAALEANANEIAQDVLDRPVASSVSDPRRTLLNKFLEQTAGNAIERYEVLALLLDKTPAPGRNEWEEAGYLLQFRNKILHFKPAWDDNDIHNGKLVKELRRRITVYRAYQHKFLFPYGLITYACAKWAVQSAINFADSFANDLGIPNRFAQCDCTLP